MIRIRMLVPAIGAAFVLGACAPESEPGAGAEDMTGAETAPGPDAADESASTGIPERIVMERGGFVPEGVEYDNINERFLTGSLAEGTLFEIANDGSMTPFVTDSDLVSSVGIEVDEPRERVVAANSDRAVFQGGAQGQAKVGVYELSTGDRRAMVDLAPLVEAGENASFFANDVVVADDGTIYATDTMQNVIYAVNDDYEGSVFYRFDPMEGLSLNGIEFHSNGYLIVVGGPNLYKVPLDNPDETSRISLPEPMRGADGIVFDSMGRLAVVSNSASRVVALVSDDDWASATIDAVATFQGQATTGAVVGDDIYVVQPHFADQEPPVILRAQFQ